MLNKHINDFTLKELQDVEYQDYDGTYITEIIVVPVNKQHPSKYRCMKYILYNHLSSHIAGVLGGSSDVMQFDRFSNLRSIRIDCLYHSKCLRFMLTPSICLSDFSLIINDGFYIQEKK